MENIFKNQIIIILLGILTIIALGFVVSETSGIILPLMIAWLLSFIFSRAVTIMEKIKVPTFLMVVLMILFMFGLFFLIGVFINGRIAAFVKEYPAYQARLTEITTTLINKIKLPPDLLSDIKWEQKIGMFLVNLSSSFVSFVSNLVLVLIFLVFILLAKPYTKYKINKAFPQHAGRINTINESINNQIGNYLLIQFLISLITGFLVWLACFVIGVDFPVTWGAVAFLLNFIPTIGSIIASIPPIIIAVVKFYPNYLPAVICLFAMTVIQLTMGNIIAPKVMGDKLDLSPIVILLSLLFWGWLLGITGAILSIPITASIRIFCENIPPLQPISIMMASGKRIPHS